MSEKGIFPIQGFKSIETPFYYYDTALLSRTLDAINDEIKAHDGYRVHYAIKANYNPIVLSQVSKAGLGADCVSGGEILAALEAGIQKEKIVFAGVGKTDKEILIGLDNDIACFNVESREELEVINSLAQKKGKIAPIALRVNPDIEAHTHANITTGRAENKFGIPLSEIENVILLSKKLEGIKFIGLHFHIGSQILDMSDFIPLCECINHLQEKLEEKGITLESINVGGGLGVNYINPDSQPIPNFKSYFDTYAQNLKLRKGQSLHFELGRSVVAQAGTLISRVVYVKQGLQKKFAIIDAGFTDLIRPALYQAYHKIENISSSGPEAMYDVVGPICESTDVFAKATYLNECHRGDFIALRSAGAYGEAMASRYNLRDLPKSYQTQDFNF
ncbi:MAG: diaminopimelate decarboxylase [Prevotella sp.]|nr:diaminopimelate decarboxylase [Prevotella sp.]